MRMTATVFENAAGRTINKRHLIIFDDDIRQASPAGLPGQPRPFACLPAAVLAGLGAARRWVLGLLHASKPCSCCIQGCAPAQPSSSLPAHPGASLAVHHRARRAPSGATRPVRWTMSMWSWT